MEKDIRPGVVVQFEDCGTRFRGRVEEVSWRSQITVSLTHCNGVHLSNPDQHAYMVVPASRLNRWYEM